MSKQSEICLLSGRERIVEVDELSCGCCAHSIFGFVVADGCTIHDAAKLQDERVKPQTKEERE